MFSGEGRRGAAWVVLTIACAISIVLPSSASAATFFVNSLGDQADESAGAAGCKTSLNTCTLRAAIEESNASTTGRDQIGFSNAFDGQAVDTIQLTAQLPAITQPVTIDGANGFSPCVTEVTVPGPCAGVNGVSNEVAFQVEVSGVEVKNLAITGAKVAINGVAAQGLWVQGDWIGIKLDDSAGPNGKGVVLDQQSDGSYIGGANGLQLVFGNNTTEALDLRGTDGVQVQGTYFGTNSYGLFPAPNGTNIEITDASSGADAAATGNSIGAWLTQPMRETQACDGFCNVVAGAQGAGIDLAGDDPDEAPASGPTEIFGNYFGLEALGSEVIANSDTGIEVGAADGVIIGASATGAANLFNGGDSAISSSPGAYRMEIVGNLIGLSSDGLETLDPPSEFGLSISSGEPSGPPGAGPDLAPLIELNLISMQQGIAIRQQGNGATINENTIGQAIDGGSVAGAGIGISVLGEGQVGNLIRGNLISNTTGSGILISNSFNAIRNNSVVNSGSSGIRIAGAAEGATGNSIGDFDTEPANWISGSNGAAIEITGPAETDNFVGWNAAVENAGPFIDLGPDGSGPNRGVQAPVVTSTTASQISGSALPGATLQVYGKNTSSSGEVGGFLGETIADGGGNWSIAVSGYRWYGVTQTYGDPSDPIADPLGTSEMAIADTMPPVQPPAAPGVPLVVPKPAPNTLISKGPKTTRSTTVKFVFRSTSSGSTFRCKLDKKAFASCRSPKTYRGLKPGQHVFKVKAIGSDGRADGTPAVRKFKIVR